MTSDSPTTSTGTLLRTEAPLPSCPNAFRPQQNTPPARFTAHACASPAAISTESPFATIVETSGVATAPGVDVERALEVRAAVGLGEAGGAEGAALGDAGDAIGE